MYSPPRGAAMAGLYSSIRAASLTVSSAVTRLLSSPLGLCTPALPSRHLPLITGAASHWALNCNGMSMDELLILLFILYTFTLPSWHRVDTETRRVFGDYGH